MEFRLYYRGPLNADGGLEQKHAIRRALAPQMAALWAQEPLKGAAEYLIGPRSTPDHSLRYQRGGSSFVALVSSRLWMHAELDVLFLRPGEPGAVVRHGGDLDNRMKTLFDGLRLPQASELPRDAPTTTTADPMHCLLEDDALISGLSIATDRLLLPAAPDEVVLIIRVKLRFARSSIATMGLV